MKKTGFASQCVHHFKDNETTRPHQLPIYATSSFEFETINQGIDIFSGARQGHTYGRYGNPTIDAVAKKIAALEGYDLDKEVSGLFVSSGMAAISTLLLALLDAGDKILTQDNLYGGSTELLNKVLQKKGIEVIYANFQDLNSVEQILAKEEKIKVVYLETPANPTMACIDLEALAGLARKYNAVSAVDNTFCTPYLQQPLFWGLDYVIHSTTKFLNGHGNAISGVIVSPHFEDMKKKVWATMKLLGTTGNPFDAWLVNNGLKTLALRMEKHSANATAVARFLEKHPKVAKVNSVALESHPSYALAQKQMKGPGGMMSFELKDGMEAGIRFMNKIEFCTLAPTLGDVDTLMLHPASMSHRGVDKAIRQKIGITDGLVRISVGIETTEDIIGDIGQALDAV